MRPTGSKGNDKEDRQNSNKEIKWAWSWFFDIKDPTTFLCLAFRKITAGFTYWTRHGHNMYLKNKTITEQAVMCCNVFCSLSCFVCFIVLTSYNRTDQEITKNHSLTVRKCNLFSQSTTGCNSRPHLQLTTENPLASPANPFHNEL